MEPGDEITRPDPRRGLSPRKLAVVFIVTMILSAVVAFLVVSGHISPDPLAKGFAVFLMAGLPVLSKLSLSRLRRRGAPAPPPLKLYRSVIIFHWAIALIAVELLLAQGFEIGGVGFHFPGFTTFLVWTSALGLGSSAIGWGMHVLEDRGWLPRTKDVWRLVPENPRERIVCVLFFVPTIGFCEEFLYRGFLFTELKDWFPWHPLFWALVLSSAAFGLGHVDRGFTSALQVSFHGILWSLPLVISHTLYPSMTTHALYDVALLVWLGPKILRSRKSADAVSS